MEGVCFMIKVDAQQIRRKGNNEKHNFLKGVVWGVQELL